MISTTSVSGTESVLCPSSLPSRISPWLMLPPAFEEGGNMVYKFYSLADNKVLSLNKRGGGEEELELPDDDAELLGSSHGWLALFNRRNCDLFLSNPLSRRHIKLPPLHTLTTIPNITPAHTMAFLRTWKGWDLGDPGSPRMVWKDEDELYIDEENYPWVARSEEEYEHKDLCRHLKYLVFAEHSNQLFLVGRRAMERMGPDGSYVEDIYYGPHRGVDDSVPYKTIGFDVHKIDREKGELRYMDGSLDGLVMFIGSNHSFALPAAEFPELKPNSIYFADAKEFTPPDWENMAYGGHDPGIFSYQDRTISPCYFPCDVQSIKRIKPSHLWFTPSPL
ncbi:hypothetical protein Pfo_008914 [Paulownia fortunei]|nr:hypothetical protein Pfo_008914 [Paulownia fortunei]